MTIGLDAQPGQSLLIRGGTSSIGMATAVLAKQHHMTVLSTKRNPSKTTALTAIHTSPREGGSPALPMTECAAIGVDHVLIDDGDVARQVRTLVPAGVDSALELAGIPTLPDTLRSVRVHGVVCFTTMLTNQWSVRDFYPIDDISRGVRLTAYGGNASDLPARVLQGFLDTVAAGEAVVPIAHVYPLDENVEAHATMEANTASGKLVIA